jgi:hypothetical protein
MEIEAPDPPGRVRTVQRPVYYKLLYAVLITSRKLRHYF